VLARRRNRGYYRSKAEESAAKLKKHLAYAEELTGLLSVRVDEAVGRRG
jgi:hypothetical protein